MKEINLKFYSVEEALPPKSMEVIVITDFGMIASTHYSLKYTAFNVNDTNTEEEVEALKLNGMTYWASVYPIESLYSEE